MLNFKAFHLKLISYLAFTLLMPNAHAGSEPVSHSRIEYFLAYLDSAHISLDSPASLIAKLHKICSRNGDIGAVNSQLRFKCKSIKRDGGVVKEHFALDLQMATGRSDLDNYPILFSVENNSTQTLTSRPLTSDERYRITSILSKNKVLYKDAILSVENGKAVAATAKDATIYMLPWFRTYYEYGSNNVFLVGTQKNGVINIRGRIDGDIRAIFRIPGEQYPTVLISESCDGRCEYLYSIESPNNPLVGISVH